MIAFEVSFIE